MTDFINIRPTGAHKSWFVKAEEVSAVRHHGQKLWVVGRKGLMAEFKDVTPDMIDDVVVHISSGGNLLLNVTGARKDGLISYISPQALEYAAVSAPKKGGGIDIIAGLSGDDGIEMIGLVPKIARKLIAELAARKTTVSYKPDIAYVPGGDPAALYIDAAAVTIATHHGGNQIDITFVCGAQLGVGLSHMKINIPKDTEEREIRDIFNASTAKNALNVAAARKKVMQDLARLNPFLLYGGSTEGAFLVKPEAIISIPFKSDGKDSSFTFLIKRHGANHPERHTFYFDTAEKRDQVFKAFHTENASPIAARKKNPRNFF